MKILNHWMFWAVTVGRTLNNSTRVWKHFMHVETKKERKNACNRTKFKWHFFMTSLDKKPRNQLMIDWNCSQIESEAVGEHRHWASVLMVKHVQVSFFYFILAFFCKKTYILSRLAHILHLIYQRQPILLLVYVKMVEANKKQKKSTIDFGCLKEGKGQSMLLPAPFP